MKATACPYLTACMMIVCFFMWRSALSAPITAAAETKQVVEPAVALPSSLTLGRVPDGYSVGNFGIAAAISSDGLSITKSLINPPLLGHWLRPFGKGGLTVTAGGHADFVVADQYSVFPENHVRLRSLATQVEAHVTTFAPLALTSEKDGSFDCFLPAVIIEVDVTNNGSASQLVRLEYHFLASGLHKDFVQSATVTGGGVVADEVHETVGRTQIWLLSTAPGEQAHPSAAERRRALNRAVAAQLAPGERQSIAFVLGVFDPRGYTSAKLSSRLMMESYLLDGVDAAQQSTITDALHGGRLYRQQAEFIRALPRTGDAALDVYARWYLSAAVLLTKGIRSGQVVTMGYRELNQRDSFWTTGAHLIFWPDLELKMLEESMAAQGPSGQIPLTILPTIIRDKNIDGNEYFILRAARYLRWHRDPAFLRNALPHIQRALSYLEALDTDHIGLPKQVSYWADWKDVPGAEGRTYAPSFALLWLATLKEAKFIATEGGNRALAEKVSVLYDRASERINRNVSEGGLWDRTRYVDRWIDGRKPGYTLEDQVLGAVFDVIPNDRLESIYATLNASNETPYGVRETYPYISSFEQSYGQAEYHNGGIWPYLNCVDAWSRYKHHHEADAERIIKEVAYNDLVRNNDFMPGEFLNGNTGEGEGFPIQGWDAACFSAIYFSSFGLDDPEGSPVKHKAIE